MLPFWRERELEYIVFALEPRHGSWNTLLTQRLIGSLSVLACLALSSLSLPFYLSVLLVFILFP